MQVRWEIHVMLTTVNINSASCFLLKKTIYFFFCNTFSVTDQIFFLKIKVVALK